MNVEAAAEGIVDSIIADMSQIGYIGEAWEDQLDDDLRHDIRATWVGIAKSQISLAGVDSDRSTTVVKSSTLQNISYYKEHELLQVQFKSGGVFAYANVPSAVYEEFEKAESKGSAFHKLIKGKYTEKRMA